MHFYVPDDLLDGHWVGEVGKPVGMPDYCLG